MPVTCGESGSSGLEIVTAINDNEVAIALLDKELSLTSEFIATDVDALVTAGSYVNEHANLPFDLTEAVITVRLDKFTDKLWQFATVTVGLGTGYRIQDTTIGTWLPWVQTDSLQDTELSALSLATSQLPVGLDSPIQVEFGAAKTGVEGFVDLATDGTITFNTAGKYTVTTSTHFGRVGTAASSLIFGRFLLDGVQIGATLHAKINNVDILLPNSSTLDVTVFVGQKLILEIYRDSSGHDSGGLYSAQPALVGWSLSPSAAISVSKLP